jgi:signal transduction histidine kinase
MATITFFGGIDRPARLASGGSAAPEPRPNTQELLNALRQFLYELRSDEVESDFVGRLRRNLLTRFEEQRHVKVRLSVSRSWPREIPAATASALSRVIEEALNNARLHGRADEISVRLQPSYPDALKVVVTDNGNPANDIGESRFRGVGTLGLRDRVNSLGGELRVEPGPTGSTRVSIRFPVRGKS